MNNNSADSKKFLQPSKQIAGGNIYIYISIYICVCVCFCVRPNMPLESSAVYELYASQKTLSIKIVSSVSKINET